MIILKLARRLAPKNNIFKNLIFDYMHLMEIDMDEYLWFLLVCISGIDIFLILENK